jgi:hypothetical protein
LTPAVLASRKRAGRLPSTFVLTFFFFLVTGSVLVSDRLDRVRQNDVQPLADFFQLESAHRRAIRERRVDLA